MTGRTGGRFQVVYSQRLHERLRALGEQAFRLGVGLEYVDVLRTIHDKLESEPLDWGDPQYRLHVLDVLVCNRVYGLLQVSYGVDERNRLVFVREIRGHPSSPLDRGP